MKKSCQKIKTEKGRGGERGDIENKMKKIRGKVERAEEMKAEKEESEVDDEVIRGGKKVK